MRYGKGHKDSTRQRIVEVASRQFRAGGVAGAGVAGVMAEAGLTNGAFYAHFDSKEDLVREVLKVSLEKRALAYDGDLETMLRTYLSPRHRDDPANGCPTAALVAEIARHPRETRGMFGDRLDVILRRMTARLSGGTPKSRRQRAMAIYGLMVGTLQVARAVEDRALSEEILASGLETALELTRG